MELEAFKLKVLPLRDKLLHYARRLTADGAEAEDAVQETFLRLWDHREELDRYDSIEAFAMTLVRNACLDAWRWQQRYEQLDESGTSGWVESPEHGLEVSDEARLVREIIDTLPSLQRLVLLKKDVEGLETEEIAAITGCNAEAVRSNLSRARRRVRDIYLQVVRERKRRNG